MSKVDDILTITVSNDTITPDNLQAAKWFDKHTRLYAKRHYKRELANAKRQAKQQLLKEFLELIGEDEEQLLPNPANDNYDAIQRLVGRNQQRAQLRKAAKERFK